MKKLKGYSLIEMLLTMSIIGIVMLLVGVTLTTLIQTSANATVRTTVRQEGEFIQELMRKTIRNSHTSDIFVYNSSGRVYDEASGLILPAGEVKGFDLEQGEGDAGSEIHFRPTGFDRWVCIGYFPGSGEDTKGYILKSSADDLTTGHEACFDSNAQEYLQNTILLNSTSVDVNSLNMEYYPTVGENFILTIDLEMEPIHWVDRFADDSPPQVFKQIVVSTQKLTWE